MSSFILKITALICMLADHTAYALQQCGILPQAAVYEFMRAAGRTAFPVFAFLLVQGFYKTGNRKRYFSRLLAFAFLSQLPFSMLQSGMNYSTAAEPFFLFDIPGAVLLLPTIAVWFVVACKKRAEGSLLWLSAALLLTRLKLNAFGLELFTGSYNVFYTLAFSFAVMLLLDGVNTGSIKQQHAFFCLAGLAFPLLLIQIHSDYELYGPVLILGLYYSYGRKWSAAYVLSVWGALVYLYGSGSTALFAGSILSVPLVLLYNGRRGPALKYFFYVFYPLHLSVLVLLAQIIR